MGKAHEHVVVEHRVKPAQVVLYGYPPLIFIWPLIVLGYLFYFAEPYLHLSPIGEAWAYIFTLVVVILTLGVDINRNVTIFWIVLMIGVWFAAMWFRDVKGIAIFDQIVNWMRAMQPTWSRQFGLIVSIILTVFYVIIILKARLNDRWRFVNNEIEHMAFGSVDSAMGRGAKRISTSYPDSLEFLLLMAGTITIYSAQGQTVLAKIQRVPLLPLRARKISRILESVSVSEAVMESEVVAKDEDGVGDTQGLE